MLLSQNVNRNRLELHFFDAGRHLVWKDQSVLDLGDAELRSKDPFFGSPIDGLYFFIDSSEKQIICYLTDFALDVTNSIAGIPQRFGQSGAFQTIRTQRKVSDIKFCCEELIFISYVDSNVVSFFQIHKDRNYDTQLNEISIEVFRELVYESKIMYLNINEGGNLLLFSGRNTIEHLQIMNINTIAFHRILPFFGFAAYMEFQINQEDNRIAFNNEKDRLFVVMVNMNDKNDKRLFCFNLARNELKHDMLYTVIPLDRELASLDNKMYVESSVTLSTMFLYLFYGDTMFQYVRFEPENLMMQTRDGIKDIFLPKQCTGDNRVNMSEEDYDRSVWYNR